MDKEQLTAIVTGVQQGDEQAVTKMYETFHQEIYYFIFKTVNDSDLAADLTQDAFMEILQSIRSLQEPVAFVTWSRQIAYRRCTAYFKKRHDLLADEYEDGFSVFDTIEEERGEFIPGDALDKEELKQTIHGIIDALPEEQRSAIMMRYFDEMPVAEIAKIQGVSEGTVKSRLNYGRKAIGESVKAYETKHGIRLRCVGVVPLLLWLLREYRLAKGVSLSDAGTSHAALVPAAANNTASVAAQTGIGVMAGKIAAGVVAIAISVCGLFFAVHTIQEDPTNPAPSATPVVTDFPVTDKPIYITQANHRLFDYITADTYASIAADLIELQQDAAGMVTCTPVGALYYYNENLQEEQQDNRLVIIYHLDNGIVPGGWYTYMSPNGEVALKAVHLNDLFSHYSVVCAAEFDTQDYIELLHLYYSKEVYSFWMDTKYPVHFEYGDTAYSGHTTIEDCLIALEQNLIENSFEHRIVSSELVDSVPEF